ncbi:hypothetical protein E4U41_006042 [Claviceps citrina]|nr:hypothetical protein E4U41_006042 [Claviceps citrina]
MARAINQPPIPRYPDLDQPTQLSPPTQFTQLCHQVDDSQIDPNLNPFDDVDSVVQFDTGVDRPLTLDSQQSVVANTPPPQQESSGQTSSSDVSPQANETITTWADRLEATNLTVQDATKVLKAEPKKRKRESQKWTPEMRQIMTEFELTCRAAYLVSLDRASEKMALTFHFGKIEPAETKDYCLDYGHKKFISLANTWKCRALHNFRQYIVRLSDEVVAFKNMTDPEVIRHDMTQRFTLDEFTSVFDWTRGYVNLKDSSPKVKRWCKTIWIDLGTCLKLEYNNTNNIIARGPRAKAPAAAASASNARKYDSEFIKRRWSAYGMATTYKIYRPPFKDVKLFPRKSSSSNHHTKKLAAGFDESDLYIPGELFSDEETQDM